MTAKNTKRSPGDVAAQKLTIRAQVVQALIDAHPDEFHERMALAYKAGGFEYERPMTAEEKKAAKERAAFEKAKAEFEALVAKYPGLADRARPAVPVEAVGEDDVPLPMDDEGDLDNPILGIDPALSRS